MASFFRFIIAKNFSFVDTSQKRNIKTVLLGLALVLVTAVLAISFAYFSINYEVGELFTTRGQAKNNEPKITFSENVEGITLTNTYPMPDEIGIEKSDEYVFTVGNESDKTVKIDVTLKVDSTSTLNNNLVNILYNGTVYTVSNLDEIATQDGEQKTFSLGSFNLNAQESKSNTIKMWINANGTVDNALNKTWQSKINVNPSFIE